MTPMLAAASLMASPFTLPALPPIRREPQITYVDRSGAVLGVRGGRFAPPVDLAKLPAYVPAAFVAIEDRRFYEHGGFDPVGMARALVADLGEGRAAQGASTLTQQLARNLFLSDARTLERKTTELMYAVQLERTFTKRQILGLYLSRVYFGAGAYGIEAAAHRYFDKPASRLTLKEAAMLAALMKSPTNYSPIDAPEASAARAALVLDAMVETGAITPAARARALAQKPVVHRTAPEAGAQYFVDWVDGQTRRLVGAPRQDLVVETTLDLPLETLAAEDTRATVARYASRGVQQAALVSLAPDGAVRALVGGVDWASAPFDRAVEAHRQAGSAWKPFVYLAALEAGRTPDMTVVDEPVTIDGWSPHNFTDTYLGPITLEHAFAESVNTVAARLADEVGRDKVAAAAHRVGIVSPIDPDPAMALGASLVTPLEMARAYDAFANGGNRVSVWAVRRIRVAGGAVVWDRPPEPPTPAIANPALGELDGLMRAVLVSGTGVRAAIPGYDLAGKTGTTSDFRDAWFCGFTGGLTTVVWMGRDDNGAMRGVTGGLAPADLWRGFMTVAMRRLPTTAIPPGPPPPVVLPVQPPSPAAPDAAAPGPQPIG